MRFLKTLSESLYFKNLDNNAGVFHRLIDDAEEEEDEEAILAYYFLLSEKKSLVANELDEIIERWFENTWNCSLDFEVSDALQKLVDLELVNKNGDRYTAISLKESLDRLKSRWCSIVGL